MELSTTLLLTLALTLLLTYLIYILRPLHFPLPLPKLWRSLPTAVSWFHTLYCNYKVANRLWRIPQLCHFISKKYGRVAELSLLGQRVLVLTDHEMAGRVMTKFSKSLRQRFGNEEGLDKLNMLRNGLIWNNDVGSWRKNRGIFEAALANGVKILDELSSDYFNRKFSPGLSLLQPNSILTLLRHYTVTMTMEALFGLDLAAVPAGWEERVISIVGNYFKAWEFFLLTPETQRFPEEEAGHSKNCGEIHQLAKEIYDLSSKQGKRSKFIQNLEDANQGDNKEQVLQCITEMLLAGTDTSSLTMFYTSLFLADYPRVGDALAGLMRGGGAKREEIEAQIARVYYESMRLISVGPVILRQAESAISWQDPETGETLALAKGDGIIFNVAGMHLRDSTFPEAETFNPSRYRQGQPLPLTFGLGNKSCVGKGFAEKEMKAFFSWFLRDHTLLGGEEGEGMVSLLQTRWDIANAPLSDIKLFVFPRIPLYLWGPKGEVERRVGEFRKLLPKVEIRDFQEGEISGEFEKNRFEIIFNLPEAFSLDERRKGQGVVLRLLGTNGRVAEGTPGSSPPIAVPIPMDAKLEDVLQMISQHETVAH